MRNILYASLACALTASTVSSFADEPPKATAAPNIAYTFTTATTGGNGQVLWAVPAAKGTYAASFTANFFPQGTLAAPFVFSCFLFDVNNSTLIYAQSTAQSFTSAGNFYTGVNGGTTIRVTAGAPLGIGCGTSDGSSWSFGTTPVSVTLISVDGSKKRSLEPIAPAQLSVLSTTAKH